MEMSEMERKDFQLEPGMLQFRVRVLTPQPLGHGSLVRELTGESARHHTPRGHQEPPTETAYFSNMEKAERLKWLLK